MKKESERFMEKSMQKLEQIAPPTDGQKEAMLHNILVRARREEGAATPRFKKMITQYPWRFAFGVSVLQAVIGTLVFGQQYTGWIFQLFGRL